MTVFDLGKNLPPRAGLDFLCGNDIFQALKDACKPAEEPISPLAGIRIEVVEDPAERKLRAFTIACITGRSILFEGDQGNILEVSMPKPAFSPFRFIPRKQQ